MSGRFKDVYLNSKVMGYPAIISPLFSTDISASDSGAEQANQQWSDPLRRISLTDGIRDHDTFEALKAHWLVMRGPAFTFPWRDPTDFASVDLGAVNQVPTVSRTDQSLGTGDGFNRFFSLAKTYTVGSETYSRSIRFPVVSTILIGVDGVDPSTLSPALTATVSREGGQVEFDVPPDNGAALTWGGLFDLQVRFEADDSFEGIMRTYGVSGFADIPLNEVRYCP